MGMEGENCRFLSSLGGTCRCPDSVHREGFCRFHFEAYVGGEILSNGQISEHLSDQHRRRALNYHGVPLEMGPSPSDSSQR